MLPKIGSIGAALLEGILIVMVVALIPHAGLMPHHVYASCCWQGNDDGEFDATYNSPVGGPYPTYAWVDESVTTSLGWNNYNCSTGVCNGISLQYNPDYWGSYEDQRCNMPGASSSCWFQAITGSDPNNCAAFYVQVYDMNNGGGPVWQAQYPMAGCNGVGGITSSSSYWLIQEDMVSSSDLHINDVYFELEHTTCPRDGCYTYMQDTIYVPHNWIWIASNIDWAGENGPSTVTFTSGAGSSNMGSNQIFGWYQPPVQQSSVEDSNMQYGCFTNAYTTSMNQAFGLNANPGGSCS